MTRTIQHTSEGDRLVSFVPIGQFGSKGVAVIDTEDLLMLEELGLSLAWNRHSRTGYVFAPAARAVGRSVQVARVLLDCGPGENVRYLNGDPTDLRRCNLSVNPEGNATRRDRDFLTPKAERRPWGPAIEHNLRTPITIDAIEAAMTTNKAWTKAQLAEWGVPWPPPKGWKQHILLHGYPYEEPA